MGRYIQRIILLYVRDRSSLQNFRQWTVFFFTTLPRQNEPPRRTARRHFLRASAARSTVVAARGGFRFFKRLTAVGPTTRPVNALPVLACILFFNIIKISYTILTRFFLSADFLPSLPPLVVRAVRFYAFVRIIIVCHDDKIL